MHPPNAISVTDVTAGTPLRGSTKCQNEKAGIAPKIPEGPEVRRTAELFYLTDRGNPMIVDQAPIMDRTVQRDQLSHDLGVLTSDVRGLPLVDVILVLLRRAEELTVIANERGIDLTAIRAFLGGEQ
jgi:hypothetical protein